MPGQERIPVRNVISMLLMVGVLTGCQTVTEAEYVNALNADWRVWPPMVEGQAFPVQLMDDPE
jgi:hypothetical protein